MSTVILPDQYGSASSNVRYSANGTSWTLVNASIPTSPRFDWCPIGKFNGYHWFAGSGSTSAVYTSDFSTWHTATLPLAWSGPTNGAVLNGRLVYVNGSSFAYTTNGTTWSTSSLPNASGGYIASSGTRLVAINSTLSSYSTDGVTWTVGPTLPAAANRLIWNGTVFMYVGTVPYTSTDGTSWSTKTTTLTGWWGYAAKKSTGTIVITIGNPSSICKYSTDHGVSWTNATLPASKVWPDVCFDEKTGLFTTFAYNASTTATSPDGITWTSRTGVIDGTNESVYAYGEPTSTNLLSVSAAPSSVATKIFSSARSSTATVSSTANAVAIKIYGILVAALSTSTASISIRNLFVYALAIASSVGSASVVEYFVKFVTALASSASSGYTKFNSTISMVSALAISNSVYTTNKIWTKIKIAVYAFSKWILLTHNSNVSNTSSDGVTWTNYSLPNISQWSGIATNGSTIVGVAKGSANAITSSNGTTWALHTMPNRVWSDIASNGSIFVAIALQSDKCSVSSDNGTTWIDANMPVMANWVSIAWNGTVFCAISNSSVVATSPDGTTWTQYTMPDNISYSCVTWALSKFTAVATGPTYLAAQSTDGVSWTRVYMPSSADWTHVGPGIGNPNV